MASTSPLSTAAPPLQPTQRRQPTAAAFLNPLPLRPAGATPNPARALRVRASLKEKAISGLTAAALTASMVIPDAAEAASGASPSLKNFLLSILAGGVVLTAIVGAVIGVSSFDPVKRS